MPLDISKLKAEKPIGNDGNDVRSLVKGILSNKADNNTDVPPVTEQEQTQTDKKTGGFWDTWVGDAVEKLNAGGAMIGKNLFGVLDKAAIGLEKAGLGTRGGAFKQASDYFKGVEEASKVNSDRYNGKSYSDLWKEGDYAGAIGDIALQGIESIPISISAAAATMAGAPIAGLAGIGALTANEKYDQLDKENPNMDEFAKVTNAILTGAAEGASEMLGAGVSKAWMKTLYKSLGKDKAEEAIKKGLMGQIQKHYKEFGMFYEPVEEGIEEVASQLAENITDKITGADPDRDISDGLKDSFIYGMGGGAYFSAAGVPGFAKRQYDKIKTRKDLKNARENFESVFADNEKMLGIESELESSTPEEKAGFLAAVNESKQFSDKEKEAIGLLVDADMNYRSMRTPEAVQEEKVERRELAIQTEMVNYDNAMSSLIAPNGMIQQVFVNGDTQNPVAIIDGDVVLDQKEDGTMFVDSKNSTPVLYYKDADGKTLPISPKNVTGVYNVVNAQDQRAQYEANLRAQLDMQDQMRAQQRKQEEAMEISNEDSVSYIDPDTGKQVNGVVRDINPDGETMSVEIDGGKLANVPKNIVVKSTIQTTSVEPELKVNNGDKMLENKVENEVSPSGEQSNLLENSDIVGVTSDDKGKEVEPEKQDKTVKPSPVVLKEDGTPDFLASGDEATFDFLQEKYGGKMQRKVEVTKNALDADLKKAQEALQKAEQAYDDAPIGKEDKAEQAWQKAKETYEAIKKEADFWAGLNETVAKANEKLGDQISKEIKEMGDPLNGEELAAQMLATGSIKLTRDSYKRETGAGNQESKKMFGLFASPEKGGVNIERAGELVMLADLEAGTNFFDQNDPNAGRNAIIEVLSSARTRGDLINYIKNAREQRAEQERQAEYNEYAAWCEENYHMSMEDYEAYEEQTVRDFMDKQLSEDEQNELDSQIADEIQAIKEDIEEIDAILAQNKQNNNENVERNDESGSDGLREGSSEILQGEQSYQAGRTGEVETGESVGSGADRTDGAAQKSESGEIKESGSGLFNYFTGSLSELIEQAKMSAGKLIKKIVAPVSDRLKNDLERNGVSITNEYNHVIDNNAIRHTLKQHGGNSETKRGQVPINDSDFDKISDIVENYDGIKVENGKRGDVNIIYSKTYNDGTTIFVEEKRDKRKELAAVTMWKMKNPILTDANSDNATPISDLNRISTAKGSESVSNGKEKSQENETSFEMMHRIASEQKMKRDISDAEQQVDVNPTDAQKEAGNYKKGHVNIDGYDITIEQPAGSVRSGKDADGKEWSVTMNNTYGYIRGTEGVDGDHIDIFLSDSPVSGRVYVVDQVNKDGSFDEHKVMYGFNSEEEAKSAYLSNYSRGWKGLGNITEISKGDFKKWIDSSKRKTKPFADYKIANRVDANHQSDSGIRFRESKDRKDLIAVHNISGEKLKEALDLGGFPMPSIAITKAEVGHTTFGDISLVFDKESIDPTDKRNKVYGEDAWTPVFPSVGYKLNDDKTGDIYRRANNVKHLPLFNPTSFYPDNYERYINGLGSESLVSHFKEDYDAKQMYLSETGNAVDKYEQREVEKYLPEKVAFYEKVLKEIGIERLKNDNYDTIENNVKQLLRDFYNLNFDAMTPFRVKMRISNTIRGAIDYAENGNKETKNDIDATKKKIDEKIDPKKFEAWLEDLFSDVVEKKGIRNEKDPFTPSGNRRKWEQLHDEITLDNVVNAMQKQAAKGGEGLFGGSIFGSAQEEYKSIEEIRKAAKERIRFMNEADYRAQRDAITDRLSAIQIPGVGNSFSDTMDMAENIQNAVARSHTAKGIHKYLKEFYPKVTMETANEIVDIVKDIQNMSARYFEAKPYRSVGFDEVRLAVVPSDTDANLVERLNIHGVEVRTYERGNEGQREQIVKEATDEMNLRFRKKLNKVDAVNQKFNEELQKQIDGTLPKGHVYQLGNPSEYLQAAGIPNLPIELAASRLSNKSMQENHPFELGEITNLPEAIQNPMAVFRSATHIGSYVVMTEIEHRGKNFVVAIQTNRSKGKIEINDIRSIHYRTSNAHMANWIEDGLLEYTDKKRMSEWFSKQRYNSAEVKKLFGRATKVVESFVNPTLEEGKISSSVEELSESLNTPVHIIRDVNEITDDNKSLQRQKRGSKGWYDTNTGEVYLVLPNAESVADAQATILHEAVAHKGLRGLLGDNFGATMDFVFDSLPQEVQEGLMNEYGDRQVAAEEYCAEMAETMSDPGIIQKICSAIKDAFRKVGINLKMSDGDIMYMLWRSKNRLEKGDTAFDVMRKVKTDAKVKEQSKEYDNLFRSKKPLSKLGLSDDQQRRIEGKMQSRLELFQEAYVDRMISVRKLQEEVEKAIGKKIPDYMNVYVYENTLSSRNTYEQSQFELKRIKPLHAAIKALREKGYSEREIENYVIAKHGIERNEYMRYAVLEKAINAIKDDVIKQQLLLEIAGKKFSDLTQLSDQKMEDLRQSLMDRDFAGLTGVYADMKGFKDFKKFKEQMVMDGKTVTDFMPEIEKFISDMETANGQEVKNLWNKIGAVNDYSLKKWFDTGMINRKTYDKIKGLYSNYVPLRGFSEAQMSDVFDYVNDRDIVYNETVKTAEGRSSRPDSPFAYMASMGDSAIVGGNKNQMKLHLYRMALEGATDMLTVNKQWYEVSYDANGNEIWTSAYPVYDEDPAIYRKNIEDFEADMLLKQSQGLADTKRGELTNDLDEKSQKKLGQHTVRVKLNGEEYVIYVNGNPKVAQAINGLNSPELTENKVLKGVAWTNRQMAANFTTRNPAFVLSNFARDFIWATSTLSVKENKKYRNKFVGNVPKAMKALKDRIKAGENWKPDPSDPISVMLDEFLRNGGRTGYTALYNIDKYKKRIEDATKTGKKAETKRKAGEVLDAMGMLNEWAEDVSRFATFMTSRQMGRSLLQSTYDAKDVTVNFNKKGSGAMGNEWFRAFYIFFNAAVQSLNNAATMAIKNPKGTLKLVAGYAIAGMTIPLLLQSLGDDDDREKYMGLPDYVRKNNVCIPLSMFGLDGFLKIPLPIELRALYGMGDSALRYIHGYDEGTEALTDATMGLLDLLPLNPVGGASTYVPSYLQPVVESYFTNTDFTGKPIAKITPFNEYDPEYQRVYKSTSVIPIKVSEYLNLLAGGDEAERKFETIKTLSGADLLNPASVEHLFEAYLGGAFTFVNQSFKTFVGVPLGLNEFTSRNVPVLNRFYDTGEVDGTMMKVNEKYFDYVDDAKKAQATYRNYEKLIDNSPSLESAKFIKKLNEYEQSDEWKRAEYILDMQDWIKDLNDEVKESNDEEYVKSLKEKIASMKKEMVEALKGGKVPA